MLLHQNANDLGVTCTKCVCDAAMLQRHLGQASAIDHRHLLTFFNDASELGMEILEQAIAAASENEVMEPRVAFRHVDHVAGPRCGFELPSDRVDCGEIGRVHMGDGEGRGGAFDHASDLKDFL